MVFACTRCLLAVNLAVNKEGWLCAVAANSNVCTFFPLDDVIANNCVGTRHLKRLKADLQYDVGASIA